MIGYGCSWKKLSSARIALELDQLLSKDSEVIFDSMLVINY